MIFISFPDNVDWMSSNRKIFVLTAGYGEGHNTAAKNVQKAIETLGDAEVQVFDLFDICYGRWNKLATKAYLTAINRTPAIWQKFYQMLHETTLVERTLFSMSKMRGLLAKMIEEQKPDAIVSTYPVYSFLLESIFPGEAQRSFVHTTIVTDSITINSVWHRARSDYFIVPNDETAKVMLREGIPGHKVKNLGFPVTPRFSNPEAVRPAPSDQAGRKVLFMINFGKREAPILLARLVQIPNIHVTVTVGRDAALHTRIAEVAAQANRKVEIFGWTDRMPELLMSHHLLISKAGGATVQESTAAKTPMIISQVVPGQEEGNARLLTENECGRVAESHEEIAATVEEAFADDGRLWRKWHTNITRLSRPGAALDIAKFVLDTTEK